MPSRIVHRTLMLSASLLALTVFAQTSSTPPQQYLPGPASSPQAPRIVSECVQSTAGAICSAIVPDLITKVVSFQVKDFMPGDESTHVYVVSGVAQAECNGAGTARPDEYGLIHERVALGGTESQQDSCQHFLTVVDKTSFDARITLDLYEVGLAPFLASLEGAMQLAVRVVTGSRTSTPRPSWWISRHQQYKEHRISVHGDNLTVDEVLDIIYQNTGCNVRRLPEGLMVDSCP